MFLLSEQTHDVFLAFLCCVLFIFERSAVSCVSAYGFYIMMGWNNILLRDLLSWWSCGTSVVITRLLIFSTRVTKTTAAFDTSGFTPRKRAAMSESNVSHLILIIVTLTLTLTPILRLNFNPEPNFNPYL